MKQLFAKALAALLIAALLMTSTALMEGGEIEGEIEAAAEEIESETVEEVDADAIVEDVELPAEDAEVIAVDPEAAELSFDDDLPVEESETVFVSDDASYDFSGNYYTIDGTTLVIEAGTTAIPDNAFSNHDVIPVTTITSVSIPNTVKTIGKNAFSSFTSLQSITVPPSVTSLGENAFENCLALESVVLSPNIKAVPDNCFYNCKSLTSLVLPEGIEELTGGRFIANCDNLLSLTIPASVNGFSSVAFEGCSRELVVHIDCQRKTDGFFSQHSSSYFKGYDVYHTPKTVVVKAPTCTEKGTNRIECEYCSEVLEAQVDVDMLPHTPEVIPAVAATATQTGLTEGKKCSVCGAILQAQQVIPKLETPAVDAPAGPQVVTIPAHKKNNKATVYLGPLYQIDAGSAAAKGYKSSKKKVAAVDKTGLLTLKKAGKVKITFKVGKNKRTLTLKVVDPTAPTKVTLAQGRRATLKVGETLQLSPTLAPDTAASTFKWRSSKRRIASVDANGLVTAKKKGTAKITVTTKNKKNATITVKVVP